MRKIAIISACALFLMIITFSCKKLVNIFGGIDAEAPTISFTLPAIPVVPPGEVGGATITTAYNLDSNIRANTGGAFGLKDVTSIKVKQVKLTVNNGTSTNNLSNFETFRMTLRSNFNAETSSKDVDFFSVAYPDTPDLYTYTATSSTDNELINYLSGTTIYYTVYGKVRRATNIALNMTLVVVLKVR